MRHAALASTAALLTLLPRLARAASEAGGSTQLFWTTANLVLLLAVLFYFGRRPLMGWLAARRDRILGEIEAAARLQREAEESHARWQRQLAELDAELDRIHAGSRERAQRERERILQDARAGAERIRNEARSAVEQELRRAREQLREEASALSIELAAELLRGQVTEADRDRLLDEFIARVERPASGSGSH